MQSPDILAMRAWLGLDHSPDEIDTWLGAYISERPNADGLAYDILSAPTLTPAPCTRFRGRGRNASMSRPRRPEYANSDRTQCQIVFPEALQHAQGVVEFPLPKRETTSPPRWWRW